MLQGEIYMADLNPIRGHEQAGTRPVLVLQSSLLNQKLSTIVVIPLTSNLRLAGLMTTFLMDKKCSGLPQDSVALLHQIRTLDKCRLIKKMGQLSQKQIQKVKSKLGNVFY